MELSPIFIIKRKIMIFHGFLLEGIFIILIAIVFLGRFHFSKMNRL